MYRRAPFIWTAKQPIDARRAVPRLPRRRAAAPRRRAQSLVPLSPRLSAAGARRTTAHAHASPSTGATSSSSTARASAAARRAAIRRISAPTPTTSRAHLRAGDNVIAMLVHVYGVDTAWYQRGATASGSRCSATARCTATAASAAATRVVDVLSDTQWRCLECAAWERDTPRVNWGLGFIEVLRRTRDARRAGRSRASTTRRGTRCRCSPPAADRPTRSSAA